MGSNTHQSFQQPNSALLRFRSAPSSLFSNFTGEINDSSFNKASSNQFDGSESESLVSRFMSNSVCNDSESSPVLHEFDNKSLNCQSQNEYSGLPPHYPRLNPAVNSPSSSSSSSISSSYGFLGSNLSRQSSSPAGVFSSITQNGYGSMKSGDGNYSKLSGNNNNNINNNGEVSPSSNRLNSQSSFSSVLPSPLRMFSSHISEIGNETIIGGDRKLANSNGESQFFNASGFPITSWNESSHFHETFPGIKRDPDRVRKLFLSNQNGEIGNRVHLLSHHLSLPKNSSDMVALEKILQLQDAVPCRIRAKRGCATHPRSIAERVRRTRISERMRKLQELVPNMDKQTNTADMLDLAVEYIKDLQKQFKCLSDKRANCKCLNMQKPVSNQII